MTVRFKNLRIIVLMLFSSIIPEYKLLLEDVDNDNDPLSGIINIVFNANYRNIKVLV